MHVCSYKFLQMLPMQGLRLTVPVWWEARQVFLLASPQFIVDDMVHSKRTSMLRFMKVSRCNDKYLSTWL